MFFTGPWGMCGAAAVMGGSFRVGGGWQAEAGLSGTLDSGHHLSVPVPGANLHDLCRELSVLWAPGQSGAGISDPLGDREYSCGCAGLVSPWLFPWASKKTQREG